jgi:superfamily II DNA/RNA helicase
MLKPSFKALGLMPELTSALTKLFITEPTPIQQKAIPSLLNSTYHHLIAAQTGTGKTLAYLLPILQRLRLEEIAEGRVLTVPSQPRSLVILPNRELTKQLEAVIRDFKHDVQLKASAAFSGHSWDVEVEELKQGVDLLVTTPDRFERHQKEQSIGLDQLRQIVVDECDTLLDAGFYRHLTEYITKFKSQPSTTLTFVSATLPPNLEKLLNRHFSPNRKGSLPYISQIVEAQTHMNLSHLKHDFLQLSEFDKYPALLNLLRETEEEVLHGGSCIVFCNSIQSCKATEHKLNESGFPAVSLHGDISNKHRTANLEQFLERRVKYLVCTDLGSRGLDFSHTKIVVQFDFPASVSDYVHRAGRTGRAGRAGAVYTFFRENDRPMIAHMEKSFMKNIPLVITTSSL